MRGPGRRRWDQATGDIGGTALLGCLVGALLASSVAVVTAVRTIEIGPKVGDILVFRQGARMAADWQFTVASATPAAPICVLKPDVMTSSGGSLVVEQRLQSPRAYRVHWAGARTSDGASDCGRGADLIVHGADMQLLTNAVGGAGVERRFFAGF